MKGGSKMEIKIKLDNDKLKEFGLDGLFKDAINNLNQMGNQMGNLHKPCWNGNASFFGMPTRPKLSKQMRGRSILSGEKIRNIEKIATDNLKEEVEEILETKSRYEIIQLILSKLDNASLGKLVQE